MTLDDIKAGDWITADGGFDCLPAGQHMAHADERGHLFIYCSGSLDDDSKPEVLGPHKHFLDGQEDEDGVLIGISPGPPTSAPDAPGG